MAYQDSGMFENKHLSYPKLIVGLTVSGPIFSLFEVFQFNARTSHPLKKVRLEKSGSLYLGCFEGNAWALTVAERGYKNNSPLEEFVSSFFVILKSLHCQIDQKQLCDVS